MPGVADHGHIHIDVLADRAGVDVDVDDLGMRCEGGEVAGHAIVKARPDGDEAIAFLHGVIRVGAAVHAKHIEALGVVLVVGAQAQQRGGAGEVGLVGDLKAVLRDLLPKVKAQDRHEWLAYIDRLKGDSAVRDIQNLPDNGHLYAAHVINDLWRETRDSNTIVVTDVGQHQMWEAQYYKHEQPRSLITSGGLGTMGFALPAAIGAKVSRPDAEVWVVVGDGGFQMTLCELATIMQEKIKINVAIINNGYLGMVRQWQEFFYERNYAATPLLNPDFAKLAEAYGMRGITVTERSQVVPTVRSVREHDGPVVIDFRVEQEDTVYPMVAAGAALNDMIRRPTPLVETAEDE